MANKLSSHLSTFNLTSLPASWNWSDDTQPRAYDTPADYIKLAKDLQRPSLTYIAQVLAKAGYIKTHELKATVDELSSLEHKESLDFGGVKVLWRVKGEEASQDKMTKDNKSANDIGDYFGVKLIAEDVNDIIKLRNALLESKNLTSRKCEFTEPSIRGFRSHKSHHNIKEFSIEVMITHEKFESIEKLTHLMMEKERELLRLALAEDRPEIRNAFNRQSLDSKDERTGLNLIMARHAGLDSLCSENSLRQLYRSISPSAIQSAVSALAVTPVKDDNWLMLTANSNIPDRPRAHALH